MKVLNYILPKFRKNKSMANSIAKESATITFSKITKEAHLKNRCSAYEYIID